MTLAAKSLICLVLAAPAFVQAQIIMCTDERGRTYTADRPIPECQGRAMRHYGKTGTVVREIPAPLTAEERQQQQLEAQKRRELVEARKEQSRLDRALLTTYRSEDAIAEARERAAAPIYKIVEYEKEALAKARERHAQALDRWSQARKSSDPNAEEWKRHADAAEDMVQAIIVRLQGFQEELARLQAEYDAKLKRYRLLKGGDDTLTQQP